MSENNKPDAEAAIETEADVSPETAPAIEVVPDPIDDLYHGECPSISGRSSLSYAIGRHQETGELHLRITDNSGKGMWFDGWASAKAIDAIVKGATELTAKSFHALHPGKSINTGGFVMAVLKDLGLIRANEDNSRIHEHVPATTLEKVVMVRMGQAVDVPAKSTRRKSKGG